MRKLKKSTFLIKKKFGRNYQIAKQEPAMLPESDDTSMFKQIIVKFAKNTDKEYIEIEILLLQRRYHQKSGSLIACRVLK